MLVLLTLAAAINQAPNAPCDTDAQCATERCESCSDNHCVERCPLANDADYCPADICIQVAPGPICYSEIDQAGATSPFYEYCAGVDSQGIAHPALGTAFVFPLTGNGVPDMYLLCGIAPAQTPSGYELSCGDFVDAAALATLIGPGFCGAP